MLGSWYPKFDAEYHLPITIVTVLGIPHFQTHTARYCWLMLIIHPILSP